MAELNFITAEEIRSWSPSRLGETEVEHRLSLAKTKIDVVKGGLASAAKQKKVIKKNLARILTVKSEVIRSGMKKAKN